MQTLMFLLALVCLSGLAIFLVWMAQEHSSPSAEEQEDPSGQAAQQAEPPAAGDDGGGPGGPLPSGAPADDVTGDSLPVSNEPVRGSWRSTDGTTSYEFRDDGTYTFAANDVREEGLYRMAENSGVLEIVWLASDDPSDLSYSYRSQIVRDGDILMLTTGDRTITYAAGELIELGELGVPDPYAIKTPLVYNEGGGYRVRIHGTQQDCIGTQSVGTELSDYEVALVIDLAAGTITGGAEISYDCPGCKDDERVHASASITIADATLVQDRHLWRYQGTATVDLRLVAHRDYGDGNRPPSCDWDHGGRFDVPFDGRIDTLGNWGSLSFDINHLHDVDLQAEPEWQWSFWVMYHTE